MDPDETMREDLKEAINNLLWVSLPRETTLAAADDIAQSWYQDVLVLWEKVKGARQ